MDPISLLQKYLPFPIPLDILHIMFYYIKMSDPRPTTDFSFINKFSDSHMLSFLQSFPLERYFTFHKMADLMLSVFIPEKRQFALALVSHTIGHILAIEIYYENEMATYKLFEQQLMKPYTFFEPDIINVYLKKFQKQLFRTALWTDRIHTLKLMVTIPSHFGEMIC
jgi:hypothetical protein